MGPLHGVRVIEIAGMGPSPLCAMLLADMGADVLRVDRADQIVAREFYDWPVDHFLNRGRRSIAVDLKHPDGAEVVLRLVAQADVLTEGYRPGVAERLGIGPDACHARNPRLVYGRMTGWGQTGAAAHRAGHDLNYVAVTGALHAIGPAGGKPVPPLNLIGDYGGGGMLLAVGVLAAFHAAQVSGRGQTVDAAMTDGAALLTTMFYGMRDMGMWDGGRGGNLLDGGAPFYDVYETADGAYVSVGAIEPHFYANLLRGMGLEGADLPAQYDQPRWHELTERFAAVFRTRTRAEWCAALGDAEACFAPVLDLDEARTAPENAARGMFVDWGAGLQPAPAPRFDRTPSEVSRPSPAPGEHTRPGLADWGFGAEELSVLEASGAIGVTPPGPRT